MPEIIRNPELEDYFVEITVDDAIALPNGLTDFYENDKVIILQNYRLDLDYAFLNELDFTPRDHSLPPDVQKRLKKMHLLAFSTRGQQGPLNHLQRTMVDSFFAGDADRFERFVDQAESAYAQIKDLRAKLFPTYVFNNDLSLTYRFTETLFENLHWDNFVGYPDRHQVRFFCNVDNAPRVWNLSYNLYSFLHERYGELGLAQFRDANPNDVINHLDRTVLGGKANSCLEDFPKHHVAFRQGEVWLADSRAISHQIYYGCRAIIYALEVDVDTMGDPNKRFNRRIDMLHGELTE